MRNLARNVLVFLSGVVTTFVIATIFFKIDKPNPTLGVLLLAPLCTTFVSVGYFATPLAALQSGLAYFIGTFLDTALNYGPAIYPDTHRFPLPELLKVLRGQLVFVAIACVLGLAGAWLRRRRNKRLDLTQEQAP